MALVPGRFARQMGVGGSCFLLDSAKKSPSVRLDIVKVALSISREPLLLILNHSFTNKDRYMSSLVP